MASKPCLIKACLCSCFAATSKHLDASLDLYSSMTQYDKTSPPLLLDRPRDEMRCGDTINRTRSFSTLAFQATLPLEFRGFSFPQALCSPRRCLLAPSPSPTSLGLAMRTACGRQTLCYSRAEDRVAAICYVAAFQIFPPQKRQLRRAAIFFPSILLSSGLVLHAAGSAGVSLARRRTAPAASPLPSP